MTEVPDLTEGGKKPWFRKERRVLTFQEWLSRFMVRVAALGAFWVLIDPRMTITDGNLAFVMNSGAFSNDLKGAVISAILIGGFTSVREYWLGNSKSGQDQAQSMTKIAEQAAPMQAQAVAAARGPAPTEAPTDQPAVTPAPTNPETGNTPAAEVAQPPKGTV